jgi:DNA-binding SARP family transcriptional activator/tetratricopeptide (TPR) repeat protein
MRLRTRRGGKGMARTGRGGNLERGTSVPAGVGPDTAHDFAPVTPMPRSPARTEFVLHLFGGPSLVQGDFRISLSPMEGLLLGFLGSHGDEGASRERACELLWSDGTRGDRRQRLAQLLLSTRRKAGDPRVIDGEGSRMRLDDQFVRTDLGAFHGSLDSGAFAEAIELLERGFLSDITADVTQSMHEWLAEYRVTLRGRIRNRLAEAVHEVDRRASFDELAELARLQLRLDPLDEEHLRRLLHARAIRGRIAEAEAEMKLFEERARILDPDWEVEEETAEMVGGLAHTGELALRSRLNLLGAPLTSSGLLGLEAEVETVRHAVCAPLADGSIALILKGEPGSGKSALLRLGLAEASSRGSLAIGLLGTVPRVDMPFAAFAAALDADRPHPGDEPAGQRGVAAALKPRSDIEGNESHPYSHWIARVCGHFEASVTSRRAVLGLDHLEGIDSESLGLVSWLAAHRTLGNATYIVCTRDDQRVAGVIGHLSRCVDFVIPVATSALSPDACYRLSQSVYPSPVRWEKDRLAKWSGGNPRIVILSPPIPDASDELDQYLESPKLDALRSELSCLIDDGPSGVHEVLSVLGTGDESWNRDLVHGATGLSAADLSTVLNHLRYVGVTVEHEGTLQIAKGAFSSYSRSSAMPDVPGQRKRTARALEATSAGLGQLAQAWALAGDRTKTVHFSCLAAEEAGRRGQLLSRVHYLEHAVRYSCDEDTEQKLAVSLALAYIDARQINNAIPLLQLAAASAFQEGRYPAWLSLEVRVIDAEGHLEGVRVSEVGGRAEELASTCLKYGAYSPAAEALDQALHFFHRAGDEDGVWRILEAARRLVVGTPGIIDGVGARLHTSLAVKAFYGHGDTGLDHAREAVALSRSSEEPALILAALNRLMIVLIARGRLRTEEGRAVTQEAIALSARSENLLSRLHPLINLAVWEADCANYDGALAQLVRLVPSVMGAQDRRPAVLVLCNVGLAEVRARRFASAEEYLTEGYGLLDSWSSEEVRAQFLAGLGWCHLEKGRISEAGRYLDILDSNSLTSSADITTLTLFKAKYLRRCGRPEEASAVIAEAMAQVKAIFPLHYIALVTERRAVLPQRLLSEEWSHEEAQALQLADSLGLSEWAGRLRAAVNLR